MDTYSVFGLTALQTEILYELERRLVAHDASVDIKHSERKFNWLSEWTQSIELYLKEQLKISDIQLFNKSNDDVLMDFINAESRDSKNVVWKYMILLECVLFVPYFQFKKEDGKKYKGLRMSKNCRCEMLERIATDFLGVDAKYIVIFEKAYNKSVKRMSNYWLKVAGVTVGVIAITLVAIFTFQYELLGLVAAEGASGAALITSGLAALGGGAVAAGGGGVAAGTAVFVGGGLLLGTAVGVPSGFAVAAATNSKLFLSQAAKMEVVLKEIVLAIQKDTAYFQKVLLNLQSQSAMLTAELQNLKQTETNNKKKISELQKSIKYLESVIGSVQK